MAATITIECPRCHNQMRASVAHIGKRGKCPNCQALVEIRPTAEESARAGTMVTKTPARRDAAAGRGDIPAWMSGLIGAAGTIALYLAVFLPVRSTWLGQLFVERDIIPYFITLVTCWGFAHLVLKYRLVKQQRSVAELELQLIPLEIGLQVTPDNVDQFLDHLFTLPPGDQHSILARRLRGALEHFKHRNSVPEVQEYLASQAEIDASTVDSGYTLLRSFIWAVPILGFIGTVMGIGVAVGELVGAMPAAETAVTDAADVGSGETEQPDMGAAMMQGMRGVTSGLSTAFDTTLLALVMAIFLLFPTESLRKTEYAMLDRIEEFCNESLLRRMTEGSGGHADMPQVVKDALHSAFQEHQRWLAQWQTQVAQLGQVIGGDFEQAVARAQEGIAASDQNRLSEIRDTAQVVDELFSRFGQATQTWQQSAAQALNSIEASAAASDRLNQSLTRNVELLNQAVETARQLPADSASNVVASGELTPVVADGKPHSGLMTRWFGRS